MWFCNSNLLQKKHVPHWNRYHHKMWKTENSATSTRQICKHKRASKGHRKNIPLDKPYNDKWGVGLLYIWDLTCSCEGQDPSLSLKYSNFSLCTSKYAKLHWNMWKSPTSDHHVVLRPGSSAFGIEKARGRQHHGAHHLRKLYPPKSHLESSQINISDA